MSVAPNVVYLKDYTPPLYQITDVTLDFDLNDNKTIVSSKLNVKRVGNHLQPLVLDGEDLELRAIIVNGEPIQKTEYNITKTNLTLDVNLDEYLLEIVVDIKPQNNTEFSGLYKTRDKYCTQCEAQGFRRITFFPDRPDIMAKYTTIIKADKDKYPVLLSNGNLIEEGLLPDNRHFAKWEDPFNKPCYLFALVAGDLKYLEDTHNTKSGKKVSLKIFVEKENIDKCNHAMQALKKAMEWDEKTYNREYDLDLYMIVAVSDFNMGAMENKGLNIFNDKYILATPETATDFDYFHIDAVVGHEYFHNWSGNRVTCRDWFQLSLKEGFTVFRENHFSSDISKSSVSRIDQVETIRTRQFKEDEGPMAHSIRPSEYAEISNFYTMTIYEKGAEVINMLKTILGWDTFVKGCNHYFAKNDGMAVTTDDFIKAHEEVSGVDLTQFKKWYENAGTPKVFVDRYYDKENKKYSLTISQQIPNILEQDVNSPMYIPIEMGLLDKSGKDIVKDKLLSLTKMEQTFEFNDIKEEPVPSLLRNFSAPVKLHVDLSNQELLFLLNNDSNDFVRYDSGVRLAKSALISFYNKFLKEQEVKLSNQDMELINAYGQIALDESLNPAFRAKLIGLPSKSYVMAYLDDVDVDALNKSYSFFEEVIAKQNQEKFFKAYNLSKTTGKYDYNPNDVSLRQLNSAVLHYLVSSNIEKYFDLAKEQYDNSNNMTDTMNALSAINDYACKQRDLMFKGFYDKWQNSQLVLNKWFGLEAISKIDNRIDRIKQIMEFDTFSIKNPNNVYALVGGFKANLKEFHKKDGSGYAFLKDLVLIIDKLNKEVSSRMVDGLLDWKKYDSVRQEAMKKNLKLIIDEEYVSKNVLEKVTKSLS